MERGREKGKQGGREEGREMNKKKNVQIQFKARDGGFLFHCLLYLKVRGKVISIHSHVNMRNI